MFERFKGSALPRAESKGDLANTKAAYRFPDNDRVSEARRR